MGVPLLLVQNGKTVASTQPKRDGSFRFQSKILKGSYTLTFSSKKYSGEKAFTLDSYELNGLVLILRKNP
jgi:hypothetical protein